MAELPTFDPYHILGVDKSADALSIKKAYRKLALLKHPDKCLDDALRGARTDEFQQLNEAYDILGDDDKRKRHDALVKLDALRKEKASMNTHPRPFARASTFHSGFPTSASTAYTSRGATNVEDRAPRMSSDEDDFSKYSRRYPEHDFGRRSAPAPARERSKSEKEATERRRDERRRESGIREARSMKYEYGDDKHEFSQRAEEEKRRREKEPRSKESPDPLRSKYADMEDGVYKYTGSTRARPAMETRPSMGRRPSTRAVPPVQVRRSSAMPKEPSRSHRDFEDQEILARERERRSREDRDKLDREAKTARRERDRRDRDYEPESPRFRSKENVAPYEQRPPSLQHSNSSPPFAHDEIRESISRTKTEPPQPKVNIPPMPRSQTMPTNPSNTSSKRVPQPSRLRESVIHDDHDYSSSSESDHKPAKSTARPVRRTHVYVPQSSSEDHPANYETRASRRTVSPEPSRPSSGALKMTNLAPKRPSAATHSRSSSHTLPLRTGRSPDRGSRRERERDRDYPREELYYGERGPASPRRDSRGNVTYSKPIKDEDVIYSQRPPLGRRDRSERDPYHGYSHPGLQRTYSIPIQTMSQ